MSSLKNNTNANHPPKPDQKLLSGQPGQIPGEVSRDCQTCCADQKLSCAGPRPRGKGRNVLILTPLSWFVEECCVQESRTTAPLGSLLLAALLRHHGHNPHVLSYSTEKACHLHFKPEVVVFFSPFHMFTRLSMPLIYQLRDYVPQAPFILVMYDSLADGETQAMLSCPALDYAVLPHEKELTVLDLVEHGERRCPGGVDAGLGLVYRDGDGQLLSSGRRKALADLDHLPYVGDELAAYLKEHSHLGIDSAAITFQRGCPNPCSFCPMRCTRPRFRNPVLVAREMEVAQNITGDSFVLCLEVLHEPEQVNALCDQLIAKNLKLTSGLGARCELVNDPYLLEKLVRVGLRYLYFGVEACTEQMRTRIKKPITDTAL